MNDSTELNSDREHLNNPVQPSAAIQLSELGNQFVLHWGEMGGRWGINRTVSQIHALLYYKGKPANAEQIADALQIARSNVSNSLKELQNWKLVRITHMKGDRRDFFETSLDIWALFSTVINERKNANLIQPYSFYKAFTTTIHLITMS